MIRPATEADADAVTAIAQAAFEHYIPRIGLPPIPMTLDYPAAIRVRQGLGRDRRTPWSPASSCWKTSRRLLLDVLAVVARRPRAAASARASLAFAETEARRRGYDLAIILYTNAAMTENLDLLPPPRVRRNARETVADRHRVFFRKPL